MKIVTEIGGETSLFQTQAVFEHCDGTERVRYTIEGDDAELSFSETFIENYRRGRCCLETRFSEGEESEIRIGSSSFMGKIPVKTTRYLLKREERERNIELIYDLLGSEKIQTFLLKIQIVILSEGK